MCSSCGQFFELTLTKEKSAPELVEVHTLYNRIKPGRVSVWWPP
jgi:hypothetical protein